MEKVLLIAFVCVCCSGCVGALLGVKEVKTSGGTTVSFITGADFHVGANGLDTIDDKRGIKPGDGYRAAADSDARKY